MKFEPHNPAWLVALAMEQRPDLPWLANALAKCTMSAWRSRQHVYLEFTEFAEADAERLPYRETISLDDPKCGHIKLDVTVDDRIMGVEFYDRELEQTAPRQESPAAKSVRLADPLPAFFVP
jgi:hypothetical protein